LQVNNGDMMFHKKLIQMPRHLYQFFVGHSVGANASELMILLLQAH
jgi:hypothetical protein